MATKQTFTLQLFFCCCSLSLIISQKLFKICIFSALWFQFNFLIVPVLRILLPVTILCVIATRHSLASGSLSTLVLLKSPSMHTLHQFTVNLTKLLPRQLLN